jgi:hypothetical protein
MEQLVAPQQGLSFSTPNLYELKGGDVHVSFSESSISGEPLLSYPVVKLTGTGRSMVF